MSDSDISSLADQLNKAMKGSRDEDTLINITVQNPLNIRLKIRDKYISLYGKDIQFKKRFQRFNDRPL